VFVDELEYGDAFGGAAVLIGGTQMAFRIKTRAHETVEVNLARHGVPKDAVLLNLNVTPIGGVGPDPFPLLSTFKPCSSGRRRIAILAAPQRAARKRARRRGEHQPRLGRSWQAQHRRSIAVRPHRAFRSWRSRKGRRPGECGSRGIGVPSR
jgi:hypothetical protein